MLCNLEDVRHSHLLNHYTHIIRHKTLTSPKCYNVTKVVINIVLEEIEPSANSLSVRLKKPSCLSRRNRTPSLSNFWDGWVARVVSSCLLNLIVKKGVTVKKKKTKNLRTFFWTFPSNELTVHHMDTSVPCIRSTTVSSVKRLLNIYARAHQSIIMSKTVSFAQLPPRRRKKPPAAMGHKPTIRSTARKWHSWARRA
jgi:hypothetical protein